MKQADGTVGLLRICLTFYGDYHEAGERGDWRTGPLIHQ